MKKLITILILLSFTVSMFSQAGWPKVRKKQNFLDSAYFNKSVMTTLGDLKNSQVGVFNVLDYGADPTGVVDATVAIQNTINAAINGLPYSDTQLGRRYPLGSVFIPAGTYKISGSLEIHGVQGFHFYGVGLESRIKIYPTGTLDYAFDIDGSSLGYFEDFTVEGDNAGTVTSVMFIHWSAKTTNASEGNVLSNIHIEGSASGLVFVNGIDIGSDNHDDVIQVSMRDIIINGSWTTGNSTTFQKGITMGDGAGGNNMLHYIYGIRLYSLGTGISMLGTGGSVYNFNFSGNGTDIYYGNPNNTLRIVDGRTESAGMFFNCGGNIGAVGSTLIESVSVRTNEINANGIWLKYSSGGALTIRNVVVSYESIADHAIIPKISVSTNGGAERTNVTLDNVTTPTVISNLFSTGNFLGVSVDIRNYSLLVADGSTTSAPAQSYKIAADAQTEPFLDFRSLSGTTVSASKFKVNIDGSLNIGGVDTTVTKAYGKIVFKTSDSTLYFCKFIKPTGKKCWFPLE